MKKYAVITDVNDIDKIKWSGFIFDHPHGNIFQTPEMYKVYQKTENYEPVFLAVVNNRGEISGTLLAVIQKQYSGILGKFTARSIIHGGPLILGDDPDILAFLVKQYNEIIKKKAIYSQFRNHWSWGDLKETFIINGFGYHDHLDIIFDLKKSENELHSEMSKTRKWGIKQSYKRGVSIKKINLTREKIFTESYKIILYVYNRVKIPMPDVSFFKNAINELHDRNILTVGAFVGDELVGVRIALCYKKMIYDWYAGSKNEYLSCRPNDILPWEVIKWGVNNGYEIFDFGGAGRPDIPYGVRDYKKQFGGELVNYGRFEKVHQSILMKIGRLGFKLWQRS